MRIDCSQRGDVTVASFSGEFDFEDVTSAFETIGRHIDKGATRLVFDLKGLEFISSGGLGYFIQTAKRARAAGGDVVLARPPEAFGWVAETLGLDRILRTFGSIDDAVGHLRSFGDPEKGAGETRATP